MNSKVIVLKRNSGDEAKMKQLAALKPTQMLQYTSAQQLSTLMSNVGSASYLLVTGGHGDFKSGKPSKFNDADIPSTEQWVGTLNGPFDAIILDTCFSSALAGLFIPLLGTGGCLVCAHGTGEGWAGGFSAENGTRTVGAVLADVIDNFSSVIGACTSISLAIKTGNSQSLYTANAGNARSKGLKAREGIGMEVDTEAELLEVDKYLQASGITVIEKSDAELANMLKENLTMTIV